MLVVLDEAYIEFSSESSRIGWVAKYPNLVVLRTFSKSAGEGLWVKGVGGSGVFAERPNEGWLRTL